MSVIIVPNTGSTYSVESQVPNSGGRWAWLGFTANSGGSGCVLWYAGTASNNGSPLMPIIAASGHQTFMAPTPFVSPCGFFAACISGGCAVIWLKSPSRGGY